MLHLSGGLGLEPPVFLSLQNIFGAGVTAGVGSVRYAYQLVAKPGWVLISTFFLVVLLPSGLSRRLVRWGAWRLLRRQIPHTPAR